MAAAPASLAQDSPRAEHEFERASSREDLGRLFDAVVDAVKKSFWDKERLAELNWLERMRGERAGVVASPDLQEAARRINLLLDELKTSHTVLLTPDDVDYYVLRGVFGRSRPYAGIGVFTARIDGRDFIDLLLEGYPADRAGLKVGDEIVSVDGAPYHPIRSFRGKVGRDAAVAIRRSADGPITSVDVDVVNIVPLKAFSDATLASARVIERDGRRIGYVHVWASVGDVPQMVIAIPGAAGSRQVVRPQEGPDRTGCRRADRRHARQDRRHGRRSPRSTSSCSTRAAPTSPGAAARPRRRRPPCADAPPC